MAQTSKDPKVSPVPPTIPTGRELFDMIMGHLEPELTTEGRKQLSERYKNETAAESSVRKQRYELAFERYTEAYEGYIAMLQTQVERYRKESFEHAELEDRGREGEFLAHLQQSIFSAA